MSFEYFCDPAYYDMYAVREVGESSFFKTIHVINKESAESLVEWLEQFKGRDCKECDRYYDGTGLKSPYCYECKWLDNVDNFIKKKETTNENNNNIR
jgi:hypothetical protein